MVWSVLTWARWKVNLSFTEEGKIAGGTASGWADGTIRNFLLPMWSFSCSLLIKMEMSSWQSDEEIQSSGERFGQRFMTSERIIRIEGLFKIICGETTGLRAELWAFHSEAGDVRCYQQKDWREVACGVRRKPENSKSKLKRKIKSFKEEGISAMLKEAYRSNYMRN